MKTLPLLHSPLCILAGTALAVVLFAFELTAQGAAFVGSAYEPFDYPDQTPLLAQNGGTGWNATGDAVEPNTSAWGTNITGSGPRIAVQGSLDCTIPNYPTEVANRATFDATVPTAGNGAIGRPFGQTIDSGTFYFSFLTQRDNDTNRTLNLSFFNGTSERFAIGQIGSATFDSGGNLALFYTNNTLVPATTPIAYQTNVVHLVIGRIDWDDGGGLNDRVRLYIDPSSVADETTLTPYIDNTSIDIGMITQFRIFAGNTSGSFTSSKGDFDELRFGTTFGDVVGIPEPTTSCAILAGLGLLLARRRSSNRH